MVQAGFWYEGYYMTPNVVLNGSPDPPAEWKTGPDMGSK